MIDRRHLLQPVNHLTEEIANLATVCVIPSPHPPPTAASTGTSASWSWVTQSAATVSKPTKPSSSELQQAFLISWDICTAVHFTDPCWCGWMDGWMTGWLAWMIGGCSAPGTVPQFLEQSRGGSRRDLHYYSNLHILIPSEFPSSTFIRR